MCPLYIVIKKDGLMNEAHNNGDLARINLYQLKMYLYDLKSGVHLLLLQVERLFS